MRTRPSIQLISVLILILLEYGLRPALSWKVGVGFVCLNPYSIGIWSATSLVNALRARTHTSYSLFYWNMVCDRMMRNDLTPYVGVLILILLEYGLRPENIKILTIKDSLNPYSIGIWSATVSKLASLVGKKMS